jgi:transcription termination factor Rho
MLLFLHRVRHARLAESAIAATPWRRAPPVHKHLVEHKKDVVILLDSITRLARAYNTSARGPAGAPSSRAQAARAGWGPASSEE